MQNFQTVHTYCFNPKSISMGELYGNYNLMTNEWTDGLGRRGLPPPPTPRPAPRVRIHVFQHFDVFFLAQRKKSSSSLVGAGVRARVCIELRGGKPALA